MRWIICEGPISIVSICLPNIFFLLQRARWHGVSSLFTRRDFSTTGNRGSNTAPSSTLARIQEGFVRIKNEGTKANAADEMFTSYGGVYNISPSAEHQSEEYTMIPLDQVHIRQKVDVSEGERLV